MLRSKGCNFAGASPGRYEGLMGEIFAERSTAVLLAIGFGSNVAAIDRVAYGTRAGCGPIWYAPSR